MSNVIGLSEEHEANLRKLAAYLRGPGQAAFDMRRFCANELDEWDAETCGAVGCAIGHGPYAGIAKDREENFVEYGDRVFGMCGSAIREDAWAWCFDAHWRSVDNSPDGAAARIEWVLAKGLPSDWEGQMDGLAPLCYREAPNA